jgi:TRAP-type C4-dicarboxylate transport system permease small subunit
VRRVTEIAPSATSPGPRRPAPPPAGAAGRLLDRVTNVCAWIAGAMLMLQVVSVSVDVILRYFWNAPIPGVVAFNEWSLLFVAFLGAAWLQREGGHVRMDILIQFVEGRPAGRAANLFAAILGIACCAVLVVFAAKAAAEGYAKNLYDYFKLRDVPIWPFYAIVSFGSLLWLLQLTREVWRSVARPRAGGA